MSKKSSFNPIYTFCFCLYFWLFFTQGFSPRLTVPLPTAGVLFGVLRYTRRRKWLKFLSSEGTRRIFLLVCHCFGRPSANSRVLRTNGSKTSLAVRRCIRNTESDETHRSPCHCIYPGRWSWPQGNDESFTCDCRHWPQSSTDHDKGSSFSVKGSKRTFHGYTPTPLETFFYQRRW